VEWFIGTPIIAGFHAHVDSIDDEYLLLSNGDVPKEAWINLAATKPAIPNPKAQFAPPSQRGMHDSWYA
jgi:hypothetical protein